MCNIYFVIRKNDGQNISKLYVMHCHLKETFRKDIPYGVELEKINLDNLGWM